MITRRPTKDKAEFHLGRPTSGKSLNAWQLLVD